MNTLEKIPLFFVDIETFINLYKKNENINLENLVITGELKIAICQIYYPEKKLIPQPYTLMATKRKIIKWRQKIAQFIIDYMVLKYQMGRSYGTIATFIQQIFYFIDWIDNNELELNSNIQTAKVAFQQYTIFLKSKIRDGSLAIRTAHTKHISAFKLLNSIYEDKENIIAAGIQLIKKVRSNIIGKSDLKDQQYHYNFYYKFFHQVTNFLLENKPYPLKVILPSQDIWFLPTRQIFYNDTKKYPMAFNYIDGTIREENEIKELFNLKSLKKAEDYRNYFLKILEDNNKYYSDNRFKLAAMSLKAFYILFLTNTGMNDSTAASLELNSDFGREKDRHRFKNIKCRAGNKPVEFQIQSNFSKDFKKFLLLREYLLNKNEFNYLFFYGYDKNIYFNFKQKMGTFSSIINRYFKENIDTNLATINSKQLRVNKTHQVIKSDGIIAASQLAQSSITTIISSYLGESQESADSQFLEYFNTLNKKIFEKSSTEKEIAIGRCKKTNTPDKNFAPIIFQNNCDYNEGCLFCKNFGLHIDKIDLQKLYSLKYVINECKYVAKDENHFLSIYGNVLKRIISIEEEIINTSKLSKKDLEEYEKDVFENENLHPYWEYKLNTLINMGVLK